MTRRQALVLCIALLTALLFRLALVTQFSTPTPDGEQYYTLAGSLRDRRVMSFSPKSPPSYTRLPGYPLFLAALTPTRASQEAHARWAARANAMLDVATALIVLLMLRDFGLRRAPWVGFTAVVLFPLLIVFSTQVVSEPLATFLTTLTLWLTCRARRAPSLLRAAGAGAVGGAALLVRADCLSVVVAASAVLLTSAEPRRRLLAAFSLAALLLYAPWPVRNLIQFGAPHFEGAQWPKQDGTPLPTGPIWWMRTWSSSAHGDDYFSTFVVFGHRVTAEAVLIPRMYDDETERAKLATLLDRVGAQGLTPAVDAQFMSLARARFAKHPLRALIVLPLMRAWHVVAPPLQVNLLGTRIPMLGPPRNYWLFPLTHVLAFAAALAGIWCAARSANLRPLLVGLSVTIVARVLIHSVAIPHGEDPRYFIEAVPSLLALGALVWDRRLI